MTLKPVALFLLAFTGILAFTPSLVLAHCDALDGPVVKAAQAAIDTANVNLVLPWVRKNDEGLIRENFEKTMEVRKLGPSARDLADRYFFETLVRVHRAGEGAPYTGLKPVGKGAGPAIEAADKAVEQGSSDEVEKLLSRTVSDGIREHFRGVLRTRNYDRNDVDAGREFVARYVSWIHYVNGIFETAAGKAEGHRDEMPAPSSHEEQAHHE